MNRIWANRLEDPDNTRWTWEDVPASRRAGVKAVLAADVENGTITAERYAEITGEAYAEVS